MRSGTARSIATVCALACVLATSGCRSCAEERAGENADAAARVTGPTMPTGMLVPIVEPDASADASGSTLRVARAVKGGAWTELQIARPGDRADRTDFQHWRDDSWFVSLEAMTLLHQAFAHALPGFDLFLPRMFAPDALVKLAAELDAFGQRASGEIASTARDVAQIANATAAKGQSLWVLGP